MNRRRFLGLTSLVGLPSCRQVSGVTHWKGIAMGIEVSVQYRGDADLKPALSAVTRAESALSLWSAESALSQLNATGTLKNPPPALLACLEKSRELFEATGGLFDPSIHTFLSWARSEYEKKRTPSGEEIARQLKLIDFSRVDFSPAKVTLPPGMSLTLNAIAQGYLTDLFADHFSASSALINFGEYRVLGDRSWPIEVKGKTHNLTRALAVSSGSGSRLSATSAANHLIDPKTGKSPPPEKVIAVEADEAWLADGLSTVVAIGGKIPARFPGAQAI
jgi:thiamine biosynthesis lipoprotein